MSAADPYASLAERYDWMKGANPAREQFFRFLFAKHGVRRVLDCACGTGHDLMLFHSMGCEVAGSDLSEAMLAQARKSLAQQQLDIPVCRADFRNLQQAYATPFDAVLCLTNAINEVIEESETLQALRSMRALLRPSGILVFDQGQTDASMHNPERFVPVVNTRDHTRMLVVDYSGDTATVNLCDFVHTENGSEFKHAAVRIRIRLQESWRQILREAGFVDVEYFGDWKSTPYDKESSRRLIAVAKNQ
jgi:ubiquinone/menaquinone biosynthesis C-methylase UbiE